MVDYLLFAAICLIWGSSFILMKKAALAFGPVMIGGLRVLGGALFLLAVWRLWRIRWGLSRRDAIPIALVVVLSYAAPYTLQPFLVDRHGSGFIGMMVALVPLGTLLVSIPMLSIWPTRAELLGVLFGLVCTGLLLKDGLGRAIPPAELVLAVCVPAMYATANTYIRQRLSHTPPLTLAMVAMGASSVLLLPASYVLPGEPVELNGRFGYALVCVGLLGVLGTGAAIAMFYKLIRDRGPLFAGMVTYLVPVGAVLWGWADAEKLTAMQLAALIGILISVAVTQHATVRRMRSAAVPAD